MGMPRIIGQTLGHGADDVLHRVEPHHVGGAVGRGFRSADGGTGERIHDIEAEAEGFGVVHHRQDRKHADAVADEVRRILGPHHALAEGAGQKALERIEHRRVGAGVGDQLHEVHVARRIEEMHAAEARAQGFGQLSRERGDRKPRGIAREHRSGLEVGAIWR